MVGICSLVLRVFFQHYLVQFLVDFHHVVTDAVRPRLLALANDVALGVGRPRSVGLVDADEVKGTVHKVNEANAEGCEEVEQFANEMSPSSDCN